MKNSDRFSANLLSVSDTAAKLKVSRQRVLELINEGRLEAFKIGPVYAVSVISVESLHLKKVGRPRKESKAA